MDTSSNPYSATGGPTNQQAEAASVAPIDGQTGSATTVPPVNDPVTNNPIVGQHNQRILQRHIVSGTSRGNQAISGQNIINDPVTNNSSIITSGTTQNQTFSNPSTQNNLIVNGKQSDGTYGQRLFDLSGNVVAQFGEQLDGSVNLKIFATPTNSDSNIGLGLAQFGRFADGTTALKIALAGFEVGSALDSQLAFNSNNPVLNIVASGFAFVAGGSIGAGLTNTRTTTVSYTLKTSYTPIVLGFTTAPLGGTTLMQGTAPLSIVASAGGGVTIQALDLLGTTPTSTGATFSAIGYNGESGTVNFPSYSIEYYVLQQSV